MLTREALEERRWGAFPALRRALAGKSLSDGYYGPTSVSDNLFSALDRLLETVLLAREYVDAVLQAAQETGRDAMLRDVDHLQGQLRSAVAFLTDQAGALDHLMARLRLDRPCGSSGRPPDTSA